MNSLNAETLTLYLMLFVPGFISMKVYELIVPSERRDFSESLLEAFGYGSVNLAILWWLFVLVHRGNFPSEHEILYYFALLLMLFAAPIAWPVLFLRILELPFLKRRVVHPLAKPWDYVFASGGKFWVILHLKDGRRIGGKYDERSFASSYPTDEQLYLEELWELAENGAFKQRVERTRGVIISASECHAVERFD